MGIEGVYYSRPYWEQKGTLWVYRFYQDGDVIFTTAHDRQRFLLPATEGEDPCWPKDILGTGEKKEHFLRYFDRDFPLKRGRFDAIIRSTYRLQGDEVSFEHDFVKGFETVRVSGRVRPQHAVLSLRCKLLSNGTLRTLSGLCFRRLDAPT